MLSVQNLKRLQIALLFLAFPVLVCIGSYEITCPEKQEETRKSEVEHYTPCQIIFVRIEHAISEIATYSANENKTQDQLAGMIAFFVNLFWRAINDPLAIITTVLAVYTYRLWKEASGAGEIAKSAATAADKSAIAANKSADTSLLSLRPWISCRAKLRSGLTYDSDGNAHIDILFFLRNHGHTPAMGVRIEPQFDMIGRPGMEHPIEARRQRVKFDRGLPLAAWEHGVVMFPRAKRREGFRFTITRAQIEQSIADIQPSKHFLPVLYVLVNYSYALASTSAHSWFVYDLRRAELHSEAGTAMTLDEPMSIESLDLRESFAWPHYVD